MGGSEKRETSNVVGLVVYRPHGTEKTGAHGGQQKEEVCRGVDRVPRQEGRQDSGQRAQQPASGCVIACMPGGRVFSFSR